MTHDIGMCRFDCVGSWQTWQDCSLTCEGGNQSRSFEVSTPASDCGISCTNTYGAEDSDTQTQGCNTQPCPVDCVGSWLPWRNCSVTCDQGLQSRSFEVSIAAAYGGSSCMDMYGEIDGNTGQQWCSMESCSVAATTTANDNIALIGGIVGGVVGLIALIGVALYFSIKKPKSGDKQIPLLSNVHEAVSISMVDISSEEVIMN